MARSKGDWHLDKRVSIGIIAAILFNSGSFIWYGSKLDSQVQNTRSEVIELRSWREKQIEDRTHIEADLAVVKQKLSDHGDILRRIDDKLERASMKK